MDLKTFGDNLMEVIQAEGCSTARSFFLGINRNRWETIDKFDDDVVEHAFHKLVGHLLNCPNDCAHKVISDELEKEMSSICERHNLELTERVIATAEDRKELDTLCQQLGSLIRSIIEDYEVPMCMYCEEDEDECCCQRCGICNSINPEGDRHSSCPASCDYRIAYEQGDLIYSD